MLVKALFGLPCKDGHPVVAIFETKEIVANQAATAAKTSTTNPKYRSPQVGTRKTSILAAPSPHVIKLVGWKMGGGRGVAALRRFDHAVCRRCEHHSS